jgi:hypothetical protein
LKIYTIWKNLLNNLLLNYLMIAPYNQQEDYKSKNEFSNPFYIIVHAKDAEKDRFLRKRGSARRVLEEIENIRRTKDYAELGNIPPETILPGIPENRPILVCGFFGEVCVKQQMNSLRKNGYDKSYICKEGTFSFN